MESVSVKIKTYCEARGMRCPIKKLVVADYLEQADRFIEAGALYLLLRNDLVSVSSATVYQSLNWLVENGFAECTVKDAKNFYRIFDQEGQGLSQEVSSGSLLFSESNL